MSVTGALLLAVIAALISYRLGYEAAHITVATECERLGRFFVGKKVYECVHVKDSAAEGDGDE